MSDYDDDDDFDDQSSSDDLDQEEEAKFQAGQAQAARNRPESATKRPLSSGATKKPVITVNVTGGAGAAAASALQHGVAPGLHPATHPTQGSMMAGKDNDDEYDDDEFDETSTASTKSTPRGSNTGGGNGKRRSSSGPTDRNPSAATPATPPNPPSPAVVPPPLVVESRPSASEGSAGAAKTTPRAQGTTGGAEEKSSPAKSAAVDARRSSSDSAPSSPVKVQTPATAAAPSSSTEAGAKKDSRSSSLSNSGYSTPREAPKPAAALEPKTEPQAASQPQPSSEPSTPRTPKKDPPAAEKPVSASSSPSKKQNDPPSGGESRPQVTALDLQSKAVPHSTSAGEKQETPRGTPRAVSVSGPSSAKKQPSEERRTSTPVVSKEKSSTPSGTPRQTSQPPSARSSGRQSSQESEPAPRSAQPASREEPAAPSKGAKGKPAKAAKKEKQSKPEKEGKKKKTKHSSASEGDTSSEPANEGSAAATSSAAVENRKSVDAAQPTKAARKSSSSGSAGATQPAGASIEAKPEDNANRSQKGAGADAPAPAPAPKQLPPPPPSSSPSAAPNSQPSTPREKDPPKTTAPIQREKNGSNPAPAPAPVPAVKSNPALAAKPEEKTQETPSAERPSEKPQSQGRPRPASATVSRPSDARKQQQPRASDDEPATKGEGGDLASLTRVFAEELREKKRALIPGASGGGRPHIPPRERHTSYLYRNTMMIVIGGSTSKGRPETTISTFNLTTNEWRTLPTGGSRPLGLVGHTCTEASGLLYVIGGVKPVKQSPRPVDRLGPTGGNSRSRPDLASSNDPGVFVFDPATSLWKTLPGANHGRTPSGRNPNFTRYHSAVHYDGCIFVFGGVKEDGLKSNDLDILVLPMQGPASADSVDGSDEEPGGEATRWRSTENVKDQLRSPPPLSGHSAVVLGAAMWIFGGKNAMEVPTNGLHRFDFAVQRFLPAETLAAKLQGEAPAPVSGHSAVAIRHQMFVFGGQHLDGSYSNALHCFNSLSYTWSAISVSGTLPGRHLHSMVVARANEIPSLIIHGGGGIILTSEYSQVAYGQDKGVYCIHLKQHESGAEAEEPVEGQGEKAAESAPRDRRRPQSAVVYRSRSPNQRGAAGGRAESNQGESDQDNDLDREEDEEEDDPLAQAERLHRLRRFNHWNLNHTFDCLGPISKTGRGEVQPLNKTQQKKLGERLAKSNRTELVARLRMKLDAAAKGNGGAHAASPSGSHAANADKDDAESGNKKKHIITDKAIAERMYKSDVEIRQKNREKLLRKYLPATESSAPQRSQEQLEDYCKEMYSRHLKALENAKKKVISKYVPAPPPKKIVKDIAATNDKLYTSAKDHKEKMEEKLRKKYLADVNAGPKIDEEHLKELVERLVPPKAVIPVKTKH